MPKVKIKDKEYDADEGGYLRDPDKFDKDWMKHVGKAHGIEELTEEHKILIDAVREYYSKTGIMPMARELSVMTRIKIRSMNKLFPTGLGRVMCQMSGLSPDHGLFRGRLPRHEVHRAVAKQKAIARRVAKHGEDA